MHVLKPKNQKSSSKIISKICDFVVILLLYFDQYRFVFLYCKSGIKIPGFRQNIKKYIITKKMFCFHAYDLVSPIYIYKYYNIIFFTQQKKFQNNICISMHFGFNNQIIQAMRTRPIFQKF